MPAQPNPLDAPGKEFSVKRLLDSGLVSVRSVDCRGTCRHRSAEECASHTHFVFPYRGVYLRHVGGDQAVADANHVLFFNEAQGYQVVREFTGHGIGRKFHTAPSILHYGKPGTGDPLLSGMTFTIEPMINLGHWKTQILEDGWTAVTVDGSLSAQFEHTVLVTEDGVEVLTLGKGETAAV